MCPGGHCALFTAGTAGHDRARVAPAVPQLSGALRREHALGAVKPGMWTTDQAPRPRSRDEDSRERELRARPGRCVMSGSLRPMSDQFSARAPMRHGPLARLLASVGPRGVQDTSWPCHRAADRSRRSLERECIHINFIAAPQRLRHGAIDRLLGLEVFLCYPGCRSRRARRWWRRNRGWSRMTASARSRGGCR